jgi:hypothetical protein
VYSPRLPSVFLPQLNKSEFAAFQEKIRKFEGFYFQKRSLETMKLILSQCIWLYYSSK